MRLDGMFIGVEVDDDIAASPSIAALLAEACPVDIFAASDGGVEIVEANLDECVLCRLCIDAVQRRDAQGDAQGRDAQGRDAQGSGGADRGDARGRDARRGDAEGRDSAPVRVLKLYDSGALLA